MFVCMLELFKRASLDSYNHRVLTPADKRSKNTFIPALCPGE